MEIYTCTFESNTATNGGAIGAYGTDVKIYTSTFERNNAVHDGGAIRITDGTLVVHDSTFDTNTVASRVGYGGAIYIRAGTLVVHDSTFDTNTADNVSE